jgi:ComF family protein
MSLAKHPPGMPHTIYHSLWKAIDWVYPPTCSGCQKSKARWCNQCQSQVSVIGENICPICGEPQNNKQICADCLSVRPPFDALRSFGIFKGPLREALHCLKYKKDIGISETLSLYLINMLKTLNWELDLITAVPLSQKRLKERGYNQSDWLSRPLSLYFGIPFVSQALERFRDTRSQVGLSAIERQTNVHGAFHSKASLVGGKNILLVDDVTTTGATIQSCTSALLQAGAGRVFGLTVARAANHSDQAADLIEIPASRTEYGTELG